MKLNSADKAEIIVLKINQAEHPIAYKAKLDELISSGMTEDDARDVITQGIPMEVFIAQIKGSSW